MIFLHFKPILYSSRPAKVSGNISPLSCNSHLRSAKDGHGAMILLDLFRS